MTHPAAGAGLNELRPALKSAAGGTTVEAVSEPGFTWNIAAT
jgi:hypothetical protein